ncbi:MAG: tRNA preQ1(34) S-adenosylmethionine ribosyltransferase-isomerase QueA [Chloroflexota bacterium]
MKTADFDYFLPPERIAQTPAQPRDSSRLLVLHRQKGIVAHSHFRDIGRFLPPGCLLVVNHSRVIPARLYGRKKTGGQVEVLLLHSLGQGKWQALVRPGARVREGTELEFSPSLQAQVVGRGENGSRILAFEGNGSPLSFGEMPLPPYIHTPLTDPERYQTVYAQEPGSVAAPTAGLHFTPELLTGLRAQGIEVIEVCLHLCLDSFRPVKEDDPQDHSVHPEWGEVGEKAARSLSQAKREGRPTLCVGTSAVRIVEETARRGFEPFSGQVSLFILPGYRFLAVDGLITNFHLPRSSHLMLTCAFAGRELILKAYQQAIAQSYRFYSFGDCMLIL